MQEDHQKEILKDVLLKDKNVNILMNVDHKWMEKGMIIKPQIVTFKWRLSKNVNEI